MFFLPAAVTSSIDAAGRRPSPRIASPPHTSTAARHFKFSIPAMAVPDLPVADTAAAPAEDVESSLEAEYGRKHEAMKRFRQESIVIINNSPIVPADTYDKLVKKLSPLFEKAGPLRPGTKVTFPRNAEGGSLGCVLVEFLNPEVAFKAKNILDGKRLDGAHTFWARISTDFKNIHNFPKEYVPPAALPTHNKDQPNYKSWLLDSRGRDMFMVRHNELTSVYWNDHVIKPSLVRSYNFSYLCIRWDDNNLHCPIFQP